MKTQYDLSVVIESEKGEISVSGVIIPESKISFDIHESFVIDSLLINGRPGDYSITLNEPSPLNPASKKVTVDIPDDDQPILSLQYHGALKKIPEWGTANLQRLALDDQINTKMVELANYSCWYPVFGSGTFDITLKVSLPLRWDCVCSGKLIKTTKKERVTTYWVSKNDWDIVIVASPHFRHEFVEINGGHLSIYYTKLPQHFVVKEAQDAKKTLELFIALLGEPVSGVSFTHVYSPKEKGQGGFTRPGMVITSEGRALDALVENPTISFLRGIAHEIAHFWWSFGVNQGDWINETFAEYFSLIAVREVSRKEFETHLKKYKAAVKALPDDAPSLCEVPLSNDEQGYVIRYYKGALMLDHFRSILGDEPFFTICREFYRTFCKKSIETAQFRQFWSEKLGDHADVLEHWITARGGHPVP